MLSTVCIADKNSLKSPSPCHNVESIDFAFCGLKNFKLAFKLMSFAFFALIAVCLSRAVKDSASALHSSGHVPKWFSLKPNFCVNIYPEIQFTLKLCPLKNVDRLIFLGK